MWISTPKVFPVVFIRGVFAGEAQGFEANYIFGWAGFYAKENKTESNTLSSAIYFVVVQLWPNETVLILFHSQLGHLLSG